MLAVDLDESAGDRADQLGAHRLVVDEGSRASIGQLHAAQDQFAVGFDISIASEDERGVIGKKIENRGHMPLRLSLADESAVAARSKRQRQRVEQNGFAGAGFAGENRQSRRELKIKLIDQDYVAD